MRSLKPAERLFVDADACSGPLHGRTYNHMKVAELASKLRGTGVGLRLRSAIASYGLGVIEEIHGFGLACWADLNLGGTAVQLEREAAQLFELRPDVVTVNVASSLASLRAFKKKFRGAEVIGATVIDDLPETETVSIYNCDPIAAVLGLARRAASAGFDGWVTAPKYIKDLRLLPFNMLVTANDVCPAWLLGADEDPKRVMDVAEAFSLGADRITVGPAIALAVDPLNAVERTLAEIIAATT